MSERMQRVVAEDVDAIIRDLALAEPERDIRTVKVYGKYMVDGKEATVKPNYAGALRLYRKAFNCDPSWIFKGN